MSNPTPSTPFARSIVGPPNTANGDSGAGGQNDYAQWWAMRPYLRAMLETDYNPRFYGTTTDDVAINAAILDASLAGGGVVWLDGSVWTLNSPLLLTAPNVLIIGAGRGATWLKPSATYSATNMILITANQCGVLNLTIAYSSTLGAGSAGNPPADGIQVTGARDTLLERLELRGVNGWAIQSQASATVANLDTHIIGVHVLHCASGIHIQGSTATGFGAQHFIVAPNLEICDSGDCLFIEDANDVQVSIINGAAAQGVATNSMFHVKGASSSILLSAPDIGVFPGPANAPVTLIEAGPNGSPSGVKCVGGVMQGGTAAISISSGKDIKFVGMTIKGASGDGAQVSGATGVITFTDCTFMTNGASAGTAYDLNLTTAASPFVYVRGGSMETPIGAGAGKVAASVNDPNHRGDFDSVSFLAASAPSQVFAAGTFPQIVRHCPGYNPRGAVTAPTIGASPFTTSTSQHDVNIMFTAINTLTAFKIGGTAVGVLPVAGVPYHVAARQSLELDYSGAAPTWQWFAD